MFTNLINRGFLAISLFAGSIALAQAPAPQQVQPPADEHVLTIYSGGLDGMLVDPKDKGLRDALKLMNDRVAELPLETGAPIPVPPIQLAWQLLSGPMSVRVGLLDLEGDLEQRPPFYATANFYTDTPKRAEGLASRFGSLLNAMARMQPKPAPDLPGMMTIDLDGAPLYFGTQTEGKPSFAIAINKVIREPLTFGKTDLPQGIDPAWSFVLDAKQLQPLFDKLLEAAGDEAGPVRLQLQAYGLYGPNATKFIANSGYGADRSHVGIRLVDYRKLMAESGMLSEQRVSAKDLRRVPADATYAQVSKVDLTGLGEYIQKMVDQIPEAQGQDVMAMVEMQTGINPQRDILDHLGQTTAVYMSDTTGGGGILSTVTVAEVGNAEALQATLNKLANMANQASTTHAKGYVRVSERTVNNQKMTVLAFPGLPVPLELCWAISEGFLYGALSPNSLLAAINQGKGDAPGLDSNPRFKEMGGDQLNDAIQVAFIDTPRMIRDGYGIVNLGTSAISNAMRSPSDPNRNVPLIMPPLNELASNAKAMVTVTRVQGDDLLMSAQADRSALVNISGLVGMLGSSGTVMTTAALAGAILPALGKARETAKETKSSVQLRNASMALMTYAMEHGNKYPESMEALVKAAYMTSDMLDSPAGDVSEGDDYWFNLALDPDDHNARRVLGYDRAMYELGQDVAVLFADSHVEVLSTEQFDDLIEEEPNADTDFELP